MTAINFEFGETKESEAFFDRYPEFFNALEQLNTMCENCFHRIVTAKPLEFDNIIFELGQSCRIDFFEIAFLAISGHGVGASKLLRGMYERAVTHKYLIANPHKLEAFIHFAECEEKRIIDDARHFLSEKAVIEQFGEAALNRIETSYQKAIKFFGGKNPRYWDNKNFWELAEAAGSEYQMYFLSAYSIPSMQIHASLASALGRPKGIESRSDGDFALAQAHSLLILVAGEQNKHFSLGLEKQIELCEKIWKKCWDKQ